MTATKNPLILAAVKHLLPDERLAILKESVAAVALSLNARPETAFSRPREASFLEIDFSRHTVRLPSPLAEEMLPRDSIPDDVQFIRLPSLTRSHSLAAALQGADFDRLAMCCMEQFERRAHGRNAYYLKIFAASDAFKSGLECFAGYEDSDSIALAILDGREERGGRMADIATLREHMASLREDGVFVDTTPAAALAAMDALIEQREMKAEAAATWEQFAPDDWNVFHAVAAFQALRDEQAEGRFLGVSDSEYGEHRHRLWKIANPEEAARRTAEPDTAPGYMP